MISEEKIKKIIEEFDKPRKEFSGLSYGTRRREWFDKPMKEIKALLAKERIQNLTMDEAMIIYHKMSVGGPKLFPNTFKDNGIEKIRNSLLYLLYSEDPIDERFYNFAYNLESEHKLNGVSRAFASTALFLSNPKEYPIWNSAIDGGLDLLGLLPKRERGEHQGKTYVKISEKLKKLDKICKFDDLSYTDEFIELIYHGKIGASVLKEKTEEKGEELIKEEPKEEKRIEEGGKKMTEGTPELNEIEIEQTPEEETEAISEGRKIFTAQGDLEIESLYGKYKRGKLMLQPDFQRYFVWDNTKSSRLIESAILNIPLPIIYLSEGKDGKEYVIDGQQRLTAFFSFIDGQFPDGKSFKLSGLEVYNDLNRKTFKEIDDELQDKVRYCNIHTITFKKESDADLRFKIFERLNTGAVSLNDQELRNCVYRGTYNNLLKDLSRDEDFMYLLNLKEPEKRMRDVEFVLRFAAFYHSTYLNYKPPMKKFLNDDMEKHLHIDEKNESELRMSFKNAVTIIRSLLDKHAFKRFYKGNEKNPNGYWEPKKFNASLYDILMYSFAKEDKNKVYQNLDSVREALIHLMIDDQEFIDSIELGTSELQAVTKRFDKWRLTLQDIIGIAQKDPRCFSLKLKEELYKEDSTCAICHQKIQSIDDAAIDHIEQYWKGGKTIPENARLTHRYCNWARPRKE
jgi:hypothetical protein